MSKKKQRSPRRSTPPSARKPKSSMPDLFVEEASVGRSTLHAIFAEIEDSLPEQVRDRMSTLGFEDSQNKKKKRIIVSRGKPSVAHEDKKGDSAPEVAIGETRAGFETMAVIEQELSKAAPGKQEAPAQLRTMEDADVLEVFTFVVLDNGLSPAASKEERVEFVRARLWHRLPSGAVDRIHRVEIRAADDTSTLLRVWVAVPKVR
jgi:hypothetical protein